MGVIEERRLLKYLNKKTKVIPDSPIKPLEEYTEEELDIMIAWGSLEKLEWHTFIKRLKDEKDHKKKVLSLRKRGR